MAAASSSSAKSGDAKQEDLEAQIAALRADFAKLAETIGAIGEEKAKDAKARAAGKAEDVRRMSKEALAEAERHIHDVEDSVARRVRERPFVALGAAAAVGFLAALLARR